MKTKYKQQKSPEQGIKKIYRITSNFLVDHFLVKTSLTPNHVTTLSLLASVLAAIFFSLNKWVFNLIGAFFVQFSIIFDFCDGGLANRKDMSSLFGRWYDSQIDRLADVIVLFGISIGLFFSNNPFAWFLGFLSVSSRLLIAFLQYSTRLIVPKGLDIIKKNVENQGFKSILIYGRVNIHLIILFFVIINKLSLGLLLVGLYGYSFYLASLFYFSKKIKKIKTKK